MWPAFNTTNFHVEEVTNAKWDEIQQSEYGLIICDERDKGSLGTQCDWRHEDMEKKQDYVPAWQGQITGNRNNSLSQELLQS